MSALGRSRARKVDAPGGATDGTPSTLSTSQGDWVKKRDVNGIVYYYNKATKERSSTPPVRKETGRA